MDSRPVCVLPGWWCGIFTTAATTASTGAPGRQLLTLFRREHGLHVLADLVVDRLDLRLLLVGQVEPAQGHPATAGASRTSASKSLAQAGTLPEAGAAHRPLSLHALLDAGTLIGGTLARGLCLHRCGADQGECGESNECMCACHGDLH